MGLSQGVHVCQEPLKPRVVQRRNTSPGLPFGNTYLPSKVANQEDSSGEREPNRLASRKHNKNLAALKKLTCIHHDQLESHPIFPKEVERRYTGQRRPHRPAWQA